MVMIYNNITRVFNLELGRMTDQEFLIKMGKSIAKVRKDRGFSQNTLCDLINMDKPNLSAIENGRQNASSLTLKRIADAMGVEVADFFL